MTFGNFLKQEKKKKIEKKKYIERIVKNRIIKDIRTLLEQGKQEYYYEPKRVSNFGNNNYIKDQVISRNLSLVEYLNNIESYLRNIIFTLQNSDAWKIQLAIAVSLISSKDSEKEDGIHSSSDNMKFTYFSDANVIEKL